MTRMYVSQHTQMIANELGIAVRFEAGVPQELHPELEGIALAHGIAPAENVAPVTPAVDEVTVEAVVAAIDTLLEKGDAKAFTTDGEPKLAAIRAIAGKTVTDALRDEAWAIVKARPQE